MQFLNPWISYFDRTFDQIRDSILLKFPSALPEITDLSETDPWVKSVSVWSGIAEMLGYYIDNAAREFYLSVAQEYSSAIKIAKLFDYRVRGPIPSSVVLRFSSNIAATGDIVIPIGTVVKTSTDDIFTTIAAGTILTGETFVDIPAKQWEAFTGIALGNSNGAADQEFELEENVADGSVTVTVNAANYSGQDTFAYSVSSSQHFIAGLQEDTKMRILFGDGINGKIPPSGHAVTAGYYITLGSAGNIGAGKITTIVSSISTPGSEVLSVNNQLAATGGTDFESLSKLAKRIPLSIRTRYRAVTPQDFIDVTELFAGVEKAGVRFDCDVDRFVNIFVVPEGGGPASQVLLDAVDDYIERRKIITTQQLVRGTGIVELKIQWNVYAVPGYSNTAVKNAVEQALITFGQPQNQSISGNAIVGDIYEVIEDVEGVLNSEQVLLVALPAARNLTTPANSLNWSKNILIGSTIIQRWLIRFITVSSYELFRGDDFVGTFSVDTLVSLVELTFTVNGNHVSGNEYEFYTYPYNQSVRLSSSAEPSIVSVSLPNLTINVTGGV
jgi:uncharacterized phage protein gp47/JayE